MKSGAITNLNLNLYQPHDVTQALTGLCCFS
jgi:hypothetical protein